jgi:4-amino-4-deoxy-L-arabinose transferase-like glycosyltransferase
MLCHGRRTYHQFLPLPGIAFEWSLASHAVAIEVAEPTTRTGWRWDALWLALGAVVLRLPAFFAPKHLTFDDGQYGAVVLGLRAGGEPFRDLFSSQGPLYYPLLAVADVVGLRTMDGPRVLTVAAGALAAVSAYAIGRHVTSRGGALLAGALVATSGSILWVTAPLAGDGPALAFAATAVALAFAYRARPTVWRAVLIGVFMGAALAVKLIVAPAAIPVGVLLLLAARDDRRRWRDAAAAVGTAVLLIAAAVLPWGPDNVWDQSVAYHQDSERLRSYGGNLWQLLVTLVERDPFVVAAVLGSLGALAWARWRHRPLRAWSGEPGVPRRLAAGLLGAWLGAEALFLVIEPTMWRPHVSQVVVPLALLAALRPAPWRVLAALWIVALPVWIVGNHEMLWPGGYGNDEQAVVDRLERLPSDALVISDDPGFAWRANRRVPGNFVDVSMKRFQQRALTTDVVARAAADRDVCAVVVWSTARLGSLPDLPARLADEGFRPVARSGGPRVLYEREDCDPRG